MTHHGAAGLGRGNVPGGTAGLQTRWVAPRVAGWVRLPHPSAPCAELRSSTIRLSGGDAVGAYGGKLGAVTAMLDDPTTDAALKQAARCGYVKSTVLVNQFGDPTSLNPDIDPQIVGATNSIFTAAQFRDATGLGRKRAIQVMEYFDRVGLLRRIGDVHRLRSDTALFSEGAS